MQCLTLTPITGVAGLWREHQAQRIDDVRACLLPRVPLTEYASHLRDRRDDPALIARLINDRQIKLLRHGPQDTVTGPPEVVDGEGGIRTLERGQPPLRDFQSRPFNRSGTSPWLHRVRRRWKGYDTSRFAAGKLEGLPPSTGISWDLDTAHERIPCPKGAKGPGPPPFHNPGPCPLVGSLRTPRAHARGIAENEDTQAQPSPTTRRRKMLLLASSEAVSKDIGLIVTFIGIGILVNIVIVLIAIQVRGERQQNQQHLQSPRQN